MKTVLQAVVAFVVCAFMSSCAILRGGGEVTVTRDGAAVSEIVVASDAPAPANTASKKLHQWVKAISGAELPIVAKRTATMPSAIRLVCGDDAKAVFPEDVAALSGTDGCAVRMKGGDIYVIGAEAKGVLNGVFRMLFRNTDIIWARPNTEFGTLYTEQQTLVFRDLDWREVPQYLMRGWQVACGIGGPEFQWAVSNCANWTSWSTGVTKANTDYGMWTETFYGHNLIGKFITFQKYHKEHPEFFAARNGKRIKPGERRLRGQLCFSNQQMTEAFIKEFEAAVEKCPQHKLYGINIEDDWICCDCPNCMADIVLPDGRRLKHGEPVFDSTRYYLFLNQVARHFKKTHPDKIISTFAYFFTENPPAIPLEDNICIVFCPIHKNVKAPMCSEENKTTWERFDGWLEKTDKLILYEYYALTWDFPRPVDVSAAADYRYEFEKGVKLGHCEIGSDDEKRPKTDSWRERSIAFWNCNSMYFWVLAQLNWNCYADVTALRKEYLRRVFGEAASDVEEYLSLTEKAWRTSCEPSTWNTGTETSWVTLAELGYVPACKAALARARSRRLSVKSRKMLERLALSFEQNDILKDFGTLKATRDSLDEKTAKAGNMLVNAGFEDVKAGIDGKHVQEDWQNAPVSNWSYWEGNAGGKHGVAKGQGIGGGSCVFVDATPSSCFIQSLPVKEGELYYVRGRAKTAVASDVAYLFVRWTQPNGRWLDKSDRRLFSGKPGADGWSTMEGLVRVPKDASRLCMLVGTPGCKGRILLDDILLFKVKE